MSEGPSDTAQAAISGSERLARIRLALSDNVGPATWHQLMDRYGSGEAALAHLPELAQRAGAGRRIRLFAEADALAVVEKTDRLGGCILMPGDPHYPELLVQTGQAPPLLFALGRTSILQEPCCGIVGSRNASANGKRFAREIATALGRAGHAVVSGLARGIDTAAHQASLGTGTIAVMATGLDVIYPDENSELAEQIAETGCVVTEMPPGTRPRAELFPRRNRIIAGLASAVVVIEAAIRSGSLITARLANELGRDVYAMPGSPYDPRSAGTNRLIRDGAALLADPQELIRDLRDQHTSHLQFREGQPAPHWKRSMEPPDQTAVTTINVEAAQRVVLELLGTDPVEVDDLIRESGYGPKEVHEVLLRLDLAGQLERHSGQRVSLVH
ncbi:MAG: DNA-processing protein DprA [Anderseniella sp.]|nr:DNA-processing protein DprA [Anderseniella sp.]